MLVKKQNVPFPLPPTPRFKDPSQGHGEQVSMALDAPFQCYLGEAQTTARPMTTVRVSGTGSLCVSVVVVAF